MKFLAEKDEDVQDAEKVRQGSFLIGEINQLIQESGWQTSSSPQQEYFKRSALYSL